MKFVLALALTLSALAHTEPQHCQVTARTLSAAAQTVTVVPDDRQAVVPDDIETQAVQHVEPPKGWTCDNRAKTDKDHLCACHRTCEWNPETRQVEEREDSGCKSYCFRDHCACLSECDSHE